MRMILGFARPAGLCLLLAACHHRDDFPMHNPQTGENVVCHSGEYNFEEGDPQMMILQACLSACERFGFRWVGEKSDHIPLPMAPPQNLKPEIPERCW